jgi:hypothetical protein
MASLPHIFVAAGTGRRWCVPTRSATRPPGPTGLSSRVGTGVVQGRDGELLPRPVQCVHRPRPFALPVPGTDGARRRITVRPGRPSGPKVPPVVAAGHVVQFALRDLRLYLVIPFRPRLTTTTNRRGASS